MTNNTPTVRWPNGQTRFLSKVIGARDVIMQGTMLVIDPSSGSKDSQPGYAFCRAGAIEEYGTLRIPHTLGIEGRLPVLYDAVAKFGPLDVLACEEIKQGMRHHRFLDWALGATVAAGRAPVFIEVPILIWKAMSRVDARYTEKSDANDARVMAAAVLHIAKYGT